MDEDELVNKRIKRLARDYGLSVEQVHKALDRHPIELDRDRYLKRTLALELLRLDELEMAFRDKAIEDRDVASGALLVKIAERRATLLGLNPVTGANVTIVQHEPLEQPSSTDRIEAAISAIRGNRGKALSPPEPQAEPDDKLN